MPQAREIVLNFGPQHPATHGVLRLVLTLDGEYIKDTKLHYGYLHRGIEKLAEELTYDQFVPVVDRLDYTNGFGNALGYVLAVEKLMGLEVPLRAQYIRVMLAELNRICSHLVWVSAFAIDLGAITPIMYCFREREMVLNIFEEISGARMTFNYFRVGGLKEDLPLGILDKIKAFTKVFPERMKDYEILLSKNPILLNRTKDVGIISKKDAINYGLTGPCLLSAGVNFDIRKNDPYSSYQDFDFDVPQGTVGDVYDRYLMRLEEMRQSIRIVEQVVDKLPQGEIMSSDPRVARPSKEHLMDNIESLIKYCYLAGEGIKLPKGEAYTRVASPRGELGYYIISEGETKPYRTYIRPPSFMNLEILPKTVEGKLVADLVAVLGSIDIVLGEVDK